MIPDAIENTEETPARRGQECSAGDQASATSQSPETPFRENGYLIVKENIGDDLANFVCECELRGEGSGASL